MSRWRLDHVQVAIPARSEERCDAFYVAVLGFGIVAKPPALAPRGGRWYVRDDATLHLGVEEDFRPARKAHPALAVEDYDDVMARLDEAGVAVRADHEIEGLRRCYVEDPVGNRIELIDASTIR